jgi:anti-sigma-K factor RskA
MTTRHDEAFAGLAEGYVLGTLSEIEAQRFVSHAAGCQECAQLIRELSAVGEAMARNLPQQTPPPGLRDRVIAGAIAQPQLPAQPTIIARPQTRRMVPAWFAAAAVIVAAVASTLAYQYRQEARALLASGNAATQRVAALEEQVRVLRTESATAVQTGSVLTASDLTRIELAGQEAAPNAAGRVFWSPTHGLVFAATNLPPLPPGRVYQLWIVADALISAGIARPLGTGFSVTSPSATPVATPKAFALTIEPEGGRPAPTGAMFLVGSL